MDREVLWFPYNILIFKCFILIHLNFIGTILNTKMKYQTVLLNFQSGVTGIVQIPQTLPPVSDLLGGVSDTL